MNDTDFQKKVLAMCEDALSYKPEERHAFLDDACAGDKTLRKAVERLIETIELIFLSPFFVQQRHYAANASDVPRQGIRIRRRQRKVVLHRYEKHLKTF